MLQQLHRHQRLEGMGGKFTLWEAGAMHRSGTNLPWPADTHRPCSHSHPFNPSALSLAGSGNISPRLLFGACQQCSFVKQRPSCQVIQSACSPFPLGIRARFLPQQPQPLSARGSRAAGRTPGSLAGTQGHHSAQPQSSPLLCSQRAGQERQRGIRDTRLGNGRDHQ